ncbi:tRNA uridine-5-carboxymethylaminomethyl(34) synthesis GTPase MnmE, partial [Desulfovibrio sp. OttesenSCG-928-M14]|nr:tRNA uridine-5-carboxymethylaminomethyl(34) synthesis GTPase MnmE [Desulfovibrio sp. OttesenSCG-928-M14]
LAAKALCAVENTVPIFAVSAKTGQGLDSLADGMRDILTKTADQSGDIAPNLRQSQLLEQSLAELNALASGQKAGLPPDILALHLNEAGRCLDEISGNVDTEAVLDKIFSAFCIGK